MKMEEAYQLVEFHAAMHEKRMHNRHASRSYTQ